MNEQAAKSGKSWLVGILGLLATTIAVNIYMVTVAARSNVGYIEDRTWERDQQFQQEINARDGFQKLGWKPKLTFTQPAADATNSGTAVQLWFDAPAGISTSGLNVSLIGRRGDNAALDFSTAMTEQAASAASPAQPRYEAHLAQRISGLWLLSVSIQRNGETLKYETREFLQ